MCRINPKVDFAFKKLFGSEENIDILMGFVNSVLAEGYNITGEEFHPIEKITLKNPYNLADYQNGKMTILDIKAQDGEGVWYDIEMQIAEQGFYDKRAFYYWAKMYTDQLEAGKGFIELRKTIGIHLIDFNYLPETNYHNMYRIYNAASYQQFSDLFELHFIEMSKFDKPLGELRSKLERWVTFLNKSYEYEKNKMPLELAEDAQIKKAIEKLDIMHLSGKEREYYENDMKRFLIEKATYQTAEMKGMQKGMEKGMEKGLEEGRKEEQRKISMRLLEMGLPVEDVARTTGLAIEEIVKLKT